MSYLPSQQTAELVEHSIQQQKVVGNQLADTKWNHLMEGINDPWTRACTAMLLENQDVYMRQMHETTLVHTPGIATFEKFAFPLVRAIFPNLVATEIVSVQPMTGPSSLIFFLQFLYGTTKGATQAGTTLFDAPDKNYAGELIEGEVVGAGDGATSVPAGGGAALTPLSFRRVRPGSVTLTCVTTGGTTVTIRDNGAGSFIGQTGPVTAGNINYATGALGNLVGVDFGGGLVLDAVPITATYEYDSEASEDIPQIDLLLTSSPVVARPRKLRARFSMEASANLKLVHGLDAEMELSTVLAEELKFEIDREIIDDLFAIANAGQVTFSKTPPAGVSFTEHKQSFVDSLVEAQNLIFLATRRAQANFVVAGIEASNIIETLPGFVPSGIQNTMGIVQTGVLNGRWTIYKDPYIATNTYLIGHKGVSFLETGYVYAPYVPLFSTGLTTLDDFVARKGLGTLYGKKAINDKFYAIGTILP